MSKNGCDNCIYALMKDYGYSNYTTEGTNFYCLKEKHPEGTFDRFYGEDVRLDYAQKCDSYQEGKPVEVDVDCENGNRDHGLKYNSYCSLEPYGDTQEIKDLIIQWQEKNDRSYSKKELLILALNEVLKEQDYYIDLNPDEYNYYSILDTNNVVFIKCEFDELQFTINEILDLK